MRKITFFILTALLGLAVAAPAMAETNATGTDSNAQAVAYSPRAVSVWGAVTAISSQTLPADVTVKISKISPTKIKNFTGTYPAKDSSVVLHLTSDTKLVRKYLGKADFSELVVGDKVEGAGKLQADGTINATMVKDQSIHVVFSASKGAVTAIDMDAKTFIAKKGDKEYKIFVTDATKFYEAGVKTPTLADLKVGDEVNVRGVVRQATNEINADSVVIKMGVKERTLKQLEVKKAAMEKKVEAAKKTLEKWQAELDAILKKIADAGGSVSTSSAQ